MHDLFWDLAHCARQFCLKVHRTSVTHHVMRGGRTNARPGGRGNCVQRLRWTCNNASKTSHHRTCHWQVPWSFCGCWGWRMRWSFAALAGVEHGAAMASSWLVRTQLCIRTRFVSSKLLCDCIPPGQTCAVVRCCFRTSLRQEGEGKNSYLRTGTDGILLRYCNGWIINWLLDYVQRNGHS